MIAVNYHVAKHSGIRKQAGLVVLSLTESHLWSQLCWTQFLLIIIIFSTIILLKILVDRQSSLFFARYLSDLHLLSQDNSHLICHAHKSDGNCVSKLAKQTENTLFISTKNRRCNDCHHTSSLVRSGVPTQGKRPLSGLLMQPDTICIWEQHVKTKWCMNTALSEAAGPA